MKLSWQAQSVVSALTLRVALKIPLLKNIAFVIQFKMLLHKVLMVFWINSIFILLPSSAFDIWNLHNTFQLELSKQDFIYTITWKEEQINVNKIHFSFEEIAQGLKEITKCLKSACR